MIRPTPLPFFSRKMSFFNMFKSWGSTCEKADSSTKQTSEVPQKYVVEKTCCPSIFEAWKPKIPELRSNPIKTQMMQQLAPPGKGCTPGMKEPARSRCEIDAEARECEKRNHPKWLKHCPPRPKNKVDGPLPVLKAALVKCKESKGKIDKKRRPKTIRKKCPLQVPTPDWNHDGTMG